MNYYNARTLIFGYKVGLNTADKVVAIPTKMLTNGQSVKVNHKGVQKVFTLEDSQLTSKPFQDKRNKSKTYTLEYIFWNQEAKDYKSEEPDE